MRNNLDRQCENLFNLAIDHGVVTDDNAVDIYRCALAIQHLDNNPYLRAHHLAEALQYWGSQGGGRGIDAYVARAQELIDARPDRLHNIDYGLSRAVAVREAMHRASVLIEGKQWVGPPERNQR
jgi:hypothetical protein